MKYKALFIAALVALSGLTAAKQLENNDVRVKIDAPPVLDKALKQSEGVRYDFGNVFTTTVNRNRFEQLKSNPAIEVSEVQKVSILAPPGACTPWPGCKGGDDGGDSSRATPSDQTPYGIEQVYADTSITSTSGGSGIDVAVLDTGVDTDHPDLFNRIEDCATFAPEHPSPKKGGFQDGECEDGNGHGTHVSGTVLADAGTDNKGIYGVAPQADLYAYKVLDDSGSGYADDIAAAIDYAANNGAEIVSMSLGADSQSSLIRDAIERHDENVVFVAAAGNDGSSIGSIDYPGANPDTIGVAAIDSNYVVPDFSSRGVSADSFQEAEGYVEVSAAGVEVLSTYNDGTYTRYSGTSMATPHIAGYAAKIWASGKADINSDNVTTAVEVRDYVQQNADTDITQGLHTSTGYDPASGLGLPTVQ